MKRPRTEGDRFHIDTTPESQMHQSLVQNEDVVSGMIEKLDERETKLEALAGFFMKDPQLTNDWKAVEGEPSALLRVEALLDRINAHRRELNSSTEEPTYKNQHDQMLSDLANRLRELL